MNISAPTLLTDDTAGAEIEDAAAATRTAAFHAQRMWHDLPLLWTITRSTLYYWLRTPAPRMPDAVRMAVEAAQAAVGSAEHAALTQHANALHAEFQTDTGAHQAYYRNAVIILYLAAHQSADWQDLTSNRAKFLTQIEAWADEHIAPGEMLELADITNQLIADSEATRAIHRPKTPTREADAGN